jgi:DNA-binding MarR family transcriptional regulator
VRRDADPDDGRAVRVSITPAGRRLLAERRAARAAALEARLSVLDAEERATLAAALPLLTRLAEA